MKPFALAGVVVVVALGACGAPEPVSRGASGDFVLDAPAAAPVSAQSWNVKSVSVDVPRSLHVSEANMFYPIADIVWRGDARGDRYAQVDAIVTEAARQATRDMTRGRPVAVEITLRRFHALTERARYITGGTYGVKLDLTLRDPATGAVIAGPKHLSAGFKAAGGQRAIDEEAQGLTEKVMIIRDLSAYLEAEIGTLTPATADRVSALD